MALQDLTPQLRTRLSRMERAVGWFVLLAILLLAAGFSYYVYNTAERKGWFKTKAPYFTFTDRATGLNIGDPVQLMGLNVGQITSIEPMDPDNFQYNMYVEFTVKAPYYDYLWTEGSRAKVVTADLLGKRTLEVTKGSGGYPTYTFYALRAVNINEARNLPEPQRWVLGEEIIDRHGTNVLMKALSPLTNLEAIVSAGYTNLVVLDTGDKHKTMTGIWRDQEGRYETYDPKKTKPYWLLSDEAPAVTERLERLVSQVEAALPNILSLTNQLSGVLSNGASFTSNLNAVVLQAQPAVRNLAAATAQLDRPGGLGEWLMPTNIIQKLEGTLSAAEGTLTSANTNLSVLVSNLNVSLDNLAGITSNLNSQVEANTNILTSISRTVVDADQFIQGLKRHWLLRSAFKTKAEPTSRTNTPPTPLQSPKQEERK